MTWKLKSSVINRCPENVLIISKNDENSWQLLVQYPSYFDFFLTACKEHKGGQAYENGKWLWYSYIQMT